MYIYLEKRSSMSKVFILTEKRETGYGLASTLNDFANLPLSKIDNDSKKGFLESANYFISWTNGHTHELLMPNKLHEEWGLFNKLPNKEAYVIPTMKDELKFYLKKERAGQVKIIHEALKAQNFTKVIIATDADAEGEAIARNVLFDSKVKSITSKLDIYRAWITGSFKSKESIDKAFKELKLLSDDKYNNLYASQRARSTGDYLSGMKLTKTITDTYNKLYAVGRVKAFLIGVLGDRELEIQNFVPKDYYTLKGFVKDLEFSHYYNSIDEDGNKVKATQYYDKDEFDRLLTKLKYAKLLGKVNKFDTIQKSTTNRPLPLSGDDFDSEMMSKYKVSLQDCEKILQYLRDEGFTTYQGTNGRYFSHADSEDVKISFNAIKNYFGDKYQVKYSDDAGLYDNKKAEKQNHPPLHTTSKVPTSKDLETWKNHKLPKLQEAYELIAKRILVSFGEDDLIETQNLTIDIDSSLFEATGRKAIKQGWREITGDIVKDSTFSSSLSVGDSVTLDKLEPKSAKTKAPALFTVKSLLDLMMNATKEVDKLIKETDDVVRQKELKKLKNRLKDAEGIGTKRTRSKTIEDLIVEYKQVKETKEKNLMLTELGWNNYNILPQEIKSIEFSANWENSFEAIRIGELSYEAFINSVDKDLASMIFQVIDEAGTKVQPSVSRDKFTKNTDEAIEDILCPLCNSALIKNDKMYKCSKQTYKDKKQGGCPFNIWRENKPLGITLNDEDMKHLLISSKDKPFGTKNKIYLNLENKYFTDVIWESKK